MKTNAEKFLTAKGMSSGALYASFTYDDLLAIVTEYEEVRSVTNFRFMPSNRQAGIFSLVDLDNSVIIGSFIKPIQFEPEQIKEKTLLVDRGAGMKEIFHLPSRDVSPEEHKPEPEKLSAKVPESNTQPEADPERMAVERSLPKMDMQDNLENGIEGEPVPNEEPVPIEKSEENPAADFAPEEKPLLTETLENTLDGDTTLFRARKYLNTRCFNSLSAAFKTGSRTPLKQVVKLHPQNIMDLPGMGKGSLNSLAEVAKLANLQFAKEVILKHVEIKEILNFV